MSSIRSEIQKKLDDVRRRIEAAVSRSYRAYPHPKLIAVSKHQDINKSQAYIDICNSEKFPAILGENYVQEFRSKKSLLTGNFTSHFIGHLQTNKVKEAVKLFDVIESVDSIELASCIECEAAKEGKKLDIFLQVNISNDPGKSGLIAPQVETFVQSVGPAFQNVHIRGLMAILMNYREKDSIRRDYRTLRELRDKLINRADISSMLGTHFLELSMGMSDDFEIAIEEGATEVRIGTAIFGER